MIQDDRKLWKLILFTIPTFGIYNIYFWFQFTKDLNEMNQEDKRIKNYILVWCLSILTLGIYRWVWLFYLADRIQVTGDRMGMQMKPGGGTVLAWKLFGSFILIGPLVADYYLIRNMTRLAQDYNDTLKKNTKVLKN